MLETIPSEELVVQVQAEDPDSPANSRAVYFISDTTFYPYSARPPFSMLGAFAINAANGLITTNRPTYEDFANGYFVLDIVVLDAKNNWFNDSMTVKVGWCSVFLSSVSDFLSLVCLCSNFFCPIKKMKKYKKISIPRASLFSNTIPNKMVTLATSEEREGGGGSGRECRQLSSFLSQIFLSI